MVFSGGWFRDIVRCVAYQSIGWAQLHGCRSGLLMGLLVEETSYGMWLTRVSRVANGHGQHGDVKRHKTY